jgi:transcriptional regulator with XRE-family HTH domain
MFSAPAAGDPSDPRMVFARAFRAAREGVGLNQRELADRIGVLKQTVSSIERDGRVPTGAVLAAASEATGVDLVAAVPPAGRPPGRRGPGRPPGRMKAMVVLDPGSVAARLKARRLRCGLSQADLAERVGLPQSYVHKVESGDKTPRPETVVRLAHALGCDPSELDARLVPGLGGAVVPVQLVRRATAPGPDAEVVWAPAAVDDAARLAVVVGGVTGSVAPVGWVPRSRLVHVLDRAAVAGVAVILRGDLGVQAFGRHPVGSDPGGSDPGGDGDGDGDD